MRMTMTGRLLALALLSGLAALPGRALAVLRGAETAAARRPGVTFASFSREGSK